MFYNDLAFHIFVTEVQRLADEDKSINWELYFYPKFTMYFWNTLNALYDGQFSSKDAYDDIIKDTLCRNNVRLYKPGDGDS